MHFYGNFGTMPPDRYSSITVTDEAFEQLVAVMVEYDCDSVADAVKIDQQILVEERNNVSLTIRSWSQCIQ
jgi:hypothetical protein